MFAKQRTIAWFYLQNRAIEKLRNRCGIVEIKNPDPNRSMIGMVRKVGASEKMKKLVQGRVEDNRKDLSEQNKENYQHNFSGAECPFHMNL